MPLILDLEKAYAQAKADPAFQAEMTATFATMSACPVAAFISREG